MAQRQMHPRNSFESNRRPTNPYETVSENTYDQPQAYSTAGAVSMATNQTYGSSAPEPRYMNQAGALQHVVSLTSTVAAPPLPPRGKNQSGGANDHIYEEPDGGGGVLLSPAFFGSRQNSEIEKELHLLRMSVSDKEETIKTLERNLEHCHGQIKHLNTILAEKKESILQYQERLSDMQTTVADLQERKQQQQQQQQQQQTSLATEEALQKQLQQVRRQLMDSQQHLNETAATNQHLQIRISQLESDRQRLQPQPGNQHELLALRQQIDQLGQEKVGIDGENQRLRSRVEVLNHQVAAYNEDFQSERSDRERAQGNIQKLKDDKVALQQFITLLAQEHHIRLDVYGMGDLANQIGNAEPHHVPQQRPQY